ncbi:lipid transfer-like protein vas [Phtheirospermum japonicum]|uniref:Lipid transfer-like protein vas n=1 Tax=Phtheirospermum japonicum TaxID=374723 RepID=A0A830BLF8_9LAMI|nr:lipid transfer-like protein vas [Phtheirospermum japonicum]
MAISKSVLLLVIATCLSSVYVGHSQGGDLMACVQKLLPCQAYMKGSEPPSAACCVPLKQILASDRQCLCTVFTDPALLKSLNVTQDDALNLVNSCGAHADSSLCKTATTPSTSTAPTTDSSAATSISHVGSLLSLEAVFSFIVFAF